MGEERKEGWVLFKDGWYSEQDFQHIYVPILVPKMLDYVCAPMPFIIGMHISMLPKLKGMPMEEVRSLEPAEKRNDEASRW